MIQPKDLRVERYNLYCEYNLLNVTANDCYLDRVVDVILDDPNFHHGIESAWLLIEKLHRLPSWANRNTAHAAVELGKMLKRDYSLLERAHAKIHNS